MRAVVTRVASASVQVEGTTIGAIERGFLILLGVGPQDGEAQCKALAEKILGLRVFEDENGKMNLGLEQVGGQILVVSQFTLHASTRKGNRPSFIRAARPEQAVPLYELFKRELASLLEGRVESGEFGADMQVSLVNDGPVTIFMDSRNRE